MNIRNFTLTIIPYAVSVRCTSKCRECHHFYKYMGVLHLLFIATA